MGARRKKSKKPSGTRAEQLLEQTTFFVDHCLGRQVGEALRAEGLCVEFHLDHFADDEPDLDWFKVVGKNGWVVLTKDKAIRRKQVEREAVLAAGIRMFTLPSGSMRGEEMTAVYVSSRLRMARFLKDHKGPFIAVVHAKQIELVAPREEAEEGAE